MELHACVRCFVTKNGTLIGLKTLIKKTDNTGTRNMHFSHRSYLIIVLTELID